MSESMLGNFSGKIGIPEGAFKRLSNKQAESALEFIIQNQINLTQVITDNQGGAGNIKWLRAKADGTKVAGSSELTCTRTGEGTYKITSSVGFTSTGGYYQVGVVATPSTVSGDGGDGVSPFKAYSDYDLAQTGDYYSGSYPELQLRYSAADGNIYIPSAQEDRVFKHTLSDFLGTVTEINPSVAIDINTNQAGVMDREGAYLWLNNIAGVNLKAVKISDGSILDFGNLATSDFFVLGAATISGTYYVIAYEPANGGVNKYTPNMSTPALGTKTLITATELAWSGYREGCWDGNSNLWVGTVKVGSLTDGLSQINPVTESFVRHDYPPDIGTTARPNGKMTYDAIRNEIYLGLTNGGSTPADNALFRVHSWVTGGSPDSAKFELILQGVCPDAMWHDTTTDVLCIANWSPTTVGPRVVMRFNLSSRTVIDTVTVSTIDAAYVQIGHGIYYAPPYAYVVGRKGADNTNALIRIEYNGAEISGGASGASYVGSVLTAQYQVTSATEAYVYLFRSLSPPIRADGEFSAHIAT